jgi:hypothetical protein
LSWKVLNAFSLTLQQCYLFAFVDGAEYALGKLDGAYNSTTKLFSGSLPLTPLPVPALYNLAITCGGIESGYTSLNAGGSHAASTVTLTTNSPVNTGSDATLTATVGTSGYHFPLAGTVRFSVGSVTIGTVMPTNGVATLNVPTSGIGDGTYSIAASYSGDTNYKASSATANLIIMGYATTTSLGISPTTVTQGQTVKFSSTVARSSESGSPTGTVTYYYSTLALGTATLSAGKGSLNFVVPTDLPAGTYSITALYNGDGKDAISTSTSESLTVIAATGTTLGLSSNPVGADSSLTMTATVKEPYSSGVPTGTVSFAIGSNSVGTANLSNGVAVLDASDFGIAAGTYTATAKYSGDANNAASSAAVNLMVN